MASPPGGFSPSVTEGLSPTDAIRNVLRLAAQGSPIDGVLTENCQLTYSDVGQLTDACGGAICEALRGRSYPYQANVVARGISAGGTAGYNAETTTTAIYGVSMVRQMYLNPQPAALPVPTTFISADDQNTTVGALTTWRWPLDWSLSQVANRYSFYDASQVTVPSPNTMIVGGTGSTPGDSFVSTGCPLFCIQVAVSPSGWSVAPSTTNTALFAAGTVIVPSTPSRSPVGRTYDSIPTCCIHIALAWVDTGGSYQTAYVKMNPFTENVSSRATVTVICASKINGKAYLSGTYLPDVTYPSTVSSIYAAYGGAGIDRMFVPGCLRPSAEILPTAIYPAGVTVNNSGVAGTTSARVGGAWVSARVYYEGPAISTDAVGLNPLSCKVILRSMAEVADLARSEDLLSQWRRGFSLGDYEGVSEQVPSDLEVIESGYSRTGVFDIPGGGHVNVDIDVGEAVPAASGNDFGLGENQVLNLRTPTVKNTPRVVGPVLIGKGGFDTNGPLSTSTGEVYY